MASSKSSFVVISSLRGGRNGTDPPSMLPDDQCVEALNVEWTRGTLAQKRNGTVVVAVTFAAGGPFTDNIASLLRYAPTDDETAAELWAVDAALVVGRLAASVQWQAPTMTDAMSSSLGVSGVALGGYFHLFHDSTQNRSHVWDAPNSRVRRTGLATPDPPTIATQGGAGLSFTRHYRIRTVDIIGSNTIRRSEPSTSVSITIADDAGVTVTRPTLPTNEHETNWEAEYADASTGPWYRASQIATATATYSDTAATISTTNLSATAGLNIPPPSAKYAIASDVRILMAGAWESSGGFVTPKNNRVWFTPALGSTDVGDAERIPTGNYVDFEEAVTGLGGPIQGSIYVFGYRRIWKLVPTGLVSAPYQRFSIISGIGCVRHQSIVMASDEAGNPALYFWSHRGPYRIGPNGLQYLGHDIEDLVATVNLAASRATVFTVSHSDKHQVWFWVATGSSDDSDTKLKFDTELGRTMPDGSVRRGWAKHTSGSAVARCAVMFSNTLGASMSRDLKPYVSHVGTAGEIGKCDSTQTDDYGVAFQAYVDTKEYAAPKGLAYNLKIGEATLIAKAASGVTITVTPKPSYGGDSAITATALLTASGSETRVRVGLEGMQAAGVGSTSYRIGDGAAVSNGWTLDAFITDHTSQEHG